MAHPRKWPRCPYTYIFCRPDGTPYYVGAGCEDRAKTYRREQVRVVDEEIKRSGFQSVLIIIEHETREDAFSLEKQLIKKYGRVVDGGLLVNQIIGRGSKGRVWTEEMREAIRITNKNRVWSEERRKLYSKRLKDRWSQNKDNMMLLHYSNRALALKKALG